MTVHSWSGSGSDGSISCSFPHRHIDDLFLWWVKATKRSWLSLAGWRTSQRTRPLCFPWRETSSSELCVQQHGCSRPGGSAHNGERMWKAWSQPYAYHEAACCMISQFKPRFLPAIRMKPSPHTCKVLRECWCCFWIRERIELLGSQ